MLWDTGRPLQSCLHPKSRMGRGIPPALGPSTVRSLTSISAGSLTVFSQTPILQALQHVQASCDEAHKMK